VLLRIATTRRPATDLGYLLHKHPERAQRFELSFGAAHVFYPEASEDRCEFALLLEVDPVAVAKGRKAGPQDAGGLGHYVNDRPYVVSSFMSVAISRVLGTALSGNSSARPELATQRLPLEIQMSAVPARRGADLLDKLFAPLGYEVEATRHELDDRFPEWGPSRYHSVTLTAEITLSEALRHLYVLIPVLDDFKHYWVGEAEVSKLLAKGEGWLEGHPHKEMITRRYLRHRQSLAAMALSRLVESDEPDLEETEEARDQEEELIETPMRLHDVRHAAVLEILKSEGVRSILDLGCGDGRLIAKLLEVRSVERVAGVDVSIRALEAAARRLRIETLPPPVRARVSLLHGSVLYRDARFDGYDAIAAIEVVEHLDAARLSAFERVVFEFARPRVVVLTTPNREYNVRFEALPADQLRHADHRFEWTRSQFLAWAGEREGQGYSFTHHDVGDVDQELGAPSQMGVFVRHD
jgi:3' terminal RNA ribose 2'-O-methyltransferase Hen1